MTALEQMKRNDYKVLIDRNVTNPFEVIKIAHVFDTLLLCGRSFKAAQHDIKSSYSLTKLDLNEVMKLSKVKGE